MPLQPFDVARAELVASWAVGDEVVRSWCAVEGDRVPADVVAGWSEAEDVEAYLLTDDDGEPHAYGELWLDDEEGEVELARLLVALAERGEPRAMYEPDDGRTYSHVEFARAVGRAVGRRVLPLPLPAALLRLGARIDRRLRGDAAKLTPDRAGYLAHPDWTADPARRLPPELWTPQVALDKGLADTARWYRDHGLL